MKILAFSFNKSALSIPGPLGLAPTNKAWSISLKPVVKLSVTATPANVGKAQSYNSMATAYAAFYPYGTSMMLMWTG